MHKPLELPSHLHSHFLLGVTTPPRPRPALPRGTAELQRQLVGPTRPERSRTRGRRISSAEVSSRGSDGRFRPIARVGSVWDGAAKWIDKRLGCLEGVAFLGNLFGGLESTSMLVHSFTVPHEHDHDLCGAG